MWGGTCVREFVRRRATLYWVDKEPQTTFDFFLGDDSSQSSLTTRWRDGRLAKEA